jgi:ribose-phosphate pyrophosphokinase
MKTYRPHKLEGIQVINFPDGQPHVRLTVMPEPGEDVRIVSPIRNPTELFILHLTMDAIFEAKANIAELVVPYLMGARYDRVIQPGDSLDLRVVANMLNWYNPGTVHLFDVHSAEALDWIIDAKSHRNDRLLQRFNELRGNPEVILIVPDKGANARVEGYRKVLNVVGEVYCDKVRDLNGKITLEVKNPDACTGNDCVIVDDLCDGGGTFLAIANQVARYEPKSLSLIVSHGIFSRGLEPLFERFDLIVTSDSYADMQSTGKLNVVNLNL